MAQSKDASPFSSLEMGNPPIEGGPVGLQGLYTYTYNSIAQSGASMSHDASDSSPLSPWWRQAVILVLIFGFSLLTLVTVKTYQGAPPIPARVVDPAGQVVLLGKDIKEGQETFFKYGLMEHGTLWGHGAYLGPDYSAEYLHRLAEIGQDTLAKARYGKQFKDLDSGQAMEIGETLKGQLKQNRYDPKTDTLIFTEAERASYRTQVGEWKDYFTGATPPPGLPSKFIQDERELKCLAGYFAWAAWATVASRPGVDYSYTNNWPFEPLVGNGPTASAYLWSALSLVSLLGGLGLILFIFGKFDYLGWGGTGGYKHAQEGRLQGWILDSQPEGSWSLLRHRGSALPGPDRLGRRPGALPCGVWSLLRLRPCCIPPL